MDKFITFDGKDIFYVIAGATFLWLAITPLVSRRKLFSAPISLVLVGAAIALLPVQVPIIDMNLEGIRLVVFEHITEILVIISLVSAGLAIDRPIGFKSWNHTWILLLVVMPLTIFISGYLGYRFLGLSLATALLLGAVIAPTDPVLARSVQVEGPNEGEENDVNVSLTSEAGLNDGLAFPFIYLAVAVAGYSVSDSHISWLWHWFSYDFLYRVIMGILIGLGTGFFLSKVIYQRFKRTENQEYHAGLILFAATFLTYGLSEIFEGYGFLSVFIAALSGRMFYDKCGEKTHASLTHHFSDQIEQIMMALLLLWLGYYVITTGLPSITATEAFISLAIVLLVRPVTAYLCLAPSKGSRLDHFAISFLGIRGIGSLYYLSYAQNHYSFENIESVWRIVLLCILISIFIHGVLAQRIMKRF